MQTLTHPQKSGKLTPRIPSPRPPRRKWFSSSIFIGAVVTLAIVLIAGGYLVTRPVQSSHAADDQVNCTLTVPDMPLTAQGLATPYQLQATDDGDCDEANLMQAAFVQAAVINPANGQVSVYDPLVVTKGTKPAAAPVVPQLPQGGIVGIWFGFNGTVLKLKGNGVQQGNCVNGVKDSPFGQVAFCNASAFFQAANQAIQAGKLTVPALGTGKDGKTCPSVRDFSVVDQDQSDNVTSTYLVTKKGKLAQDTAANRANLNAKPINNASDNFLVAQGVDTALGCQPWKVTDLADTGQTVTAQPLNELQAAAHQAAPVALVPARDPMVLANGYSSIKKLNAYRAGVDQAQVPNLDQASTKQYCQDLLNNAPQRLKLDQQFTINAASPDKAAANSLFTFLAQRFNATWGANGLNCQKLLKLQSPIKVKVNGKNVAVKATILDKAQPLDDNSNQQDNSDQQDNNN